MINIVLYLGLDNESLMLKQLVNDLLSKFSRYRRLVEVTEVHIPEYDKKVLDSLKMPAADIYVNGRYLMSVKADFLSVINEDVIKDVLMYYGAVEELAPNLP
ncbi:MAG TPA: hypothetical protein ENF75_02800 [Acidilobales archaeon]|nr:hypothetical protein [Acidilobales archaeon]